MRLKLIKLYEVKNIYANTINQVNFRNIFFKNWFLVLYIISKTDF